jgi:hypothetical protein
MVTIDLQDYPTLQWALRTSERLKILLDNFENPPVEMVQLESLVKTIKDLGCEGIQDKFDDLSKTKVYPTIAELEIAHQILRRGHGVTLLKDSFFPGKSPDMVIELEGIKAYIEVQYVSSSDPTEFLIKKLREITSRSPYIVNFTFRSDVSLPNLTHTIRKTQQKNLEDSADLFEKKLRIISCTSFPVSGDTPAFSYEIIGIAQNGRGYPAVLTASCSTTLDHSYSHLTYYLSLKGQKYGSFPVEEKSRPYIIAIVCDDPGVPCYEVKSLLYGDTKEIALSLDSQIYHRLREQRWEKAVIERKEVKNHWPEIESAADIGWTETLMKIYLIPHDYCFVEKQGLYLTCPTMKDVSGVIFCSAGRRIEFYPNPFARVEINKPQLEQQLGLSFSEEP